MTKIKTTVLAVLGGAAAVTQAGAHAFIDHTDPAVGSSVKQSPAEVRLTFDKAVDAGASSVKVFDAAGKEVDKKDLHADPKDARQMVVSVAGTLGAGAYKVEWRAVSAGDGHVTQGDFVFRVET